MLPNMMLLLFHTLRKLVGELTVRRGMLLLDLLLRGGSDVIMVASE